MTLADRQFSMAIGRHSSMAIDTLHGLLKFGQRRGRLSANAAADAERVSIVDDEDFNVLEPIEFEAVYRAVVDRTARRVDAPPDRIDALDDRAAHTIGAFLATAFYAAARGSASCGI